MDYFHITLEEPALHSVSNLGLAHLGDCVYELMVRSYLVSTGKCTAKALHRATTRLVKASFQCAAAHLLQPFLTDKEQEVFLRGRNAKPKSIPKSSSVMEYSYATALETLFGWLYLQGEYDRLNQLFDHVLSLEDTAL